MADRLKLLFVCSRNQWRSRTAESIFRDHPDYEVRSAGTASSARIRLSQKLLDWAEIVFVMENKHRKLIWDQFGRDYEIDVLHIPDEYAYLDPALIRLLQDGVKGYLAQEN